MADKLIRFVVPGIHPTSQRPSGLFQAVRELEDSGALTESELDQLSSIRDWFNTHLERPSRFSKSARPHRMPVAVSWFKPGAREHIAKIRELARLLEAHGIAVEQLHTTRPGYVVYEDEFQVTAIPFAEDA